MQSHREFNSINSGNFWLLITFVTCSTFFGNKKVWVHTSTTSTETACLKLIFTMKKVQIRHTGNVPSQKSTCYMCGHTSINILQVLFKWSDLYGFRGLSSVFQRCPFSDNYRSGTFCRWKPLLLSSQHSNITLEMFYFVILIMLL